MNRTATAPAVPKRKANWWALFVRETYVLAAEAWDLAAEAATGGYETELAEYAERNPRPTLQSTMLDLAGCGREAGEGAW